MPALDIPGYTDVQPLFQNERTLAFRALRVADNRAVVLKSVAPGTTDGRARWLLQHEAQILAELTVPGVVRSHGMELTPLGPTLVLDDVGGMTLESHGEAVPLPRFFDLAVQLARIVAGIHAAGVCHRDINPRNIVRDVQSGDISLIDFGLATKITRQSAEAIAVGRLEGTLGYLSPEQSGRMNRSVDRRTDLYSVGATLYELLVGRKPFDSSDPLEILHATVARAPRPPHELRPDLPLVLSAILLRLLAKDAEDRYQNAAALADDLARCQDQLREVGAIESFEIGTTDRRGNFSLPERLYGRRAATSALETALRRSQEGASVFVGISGAAGAGKSALSRELLRRLGERGVLGTGVCDALDRTPYAPFVQVFRTILARVVDDGPERREAHRAQLARVLEGDAGFLLRLMPELEPLIGRRELPAELSPVEARERMLAMLVRLLRAYHQPDSPMVVFLDDLQWADSSTLEVLERLLRAGFAQADDEADGSGGPLVLMAWRGDEVGADHPLARLLDAPLDVLTLGPLDLPDTTQLIGDALGLPAGEVAELAQAVHEKTSGNAFFVRELLSSLVATGLVALEPTTLRWTWSLAGIAALPPTQNVGVLLSRLLEGLPEPVQRVLGLAACIGKRFEIGLLAELAGVSSRALCQRLMTAIQAGVITGGPEVLGLVEMVDDDAASGTGGSAAGPGERGTLGFVHDEVFHAAEKLIAEGERPSVHLAVGRALQVRWRAEGGPPFAAADHMQVARALVTDPAERQLLAELNLAAGRQAAGALAFPAALHYLGAGVGLLSPTAWTDAHAVAFELHLLAAEAAMMCPTASPQATGVDFVAQGMAGTTDALERIALQRVRVLGHAAKYEFNDALRLTLEALSWVGVDLPRGAHVGHVAMALLRTTLKVRGKSLDDLRAILPNSKPTIAAAMKLLADTASVTYYSDPLLLPVLLCRMVDLSIDHGVSGTTAFGCAGWAFLQIVTRDDLPTATMWSTFARELVGRFDDRRMAPKVELLVLGFVESLTRPLALLADPFQRAGWAAKEVGDAEYTALCAMNYANFSFLGGVELPEAIRRGEAALKICREMRQESPTNITSIAVQVMECMSGAAADPAVLTGTYMNVDAMSAHMAKGGDKSGTAALMLGRVHVLTLFGDTATAVGAVEAATQRLGDLPGSPTVPPFLLHASLVWIRQMRESGRVGGRPLRQARRHLKALRRLTERGPANFAHKARLVEAELADLGGDPARAQILYEESIRLARASGILHEEAMCLEWAARAAQRLGNQRLAGVLGQDARSAWEGCGAGARARTLDDLGARGEQRRSSISNHTMRSITGATGLFEFGSVLKAAQAVSGEIELSELLRTLMKIILENAGATWGMLVLSTESRLSVVARAEVAAGADGASGGGDSVAVVVYDVGVPVAEARPHAERVVREVARSRRAVVVADGEADARYFGGVQGPPRSVICLPVRKGTNMIGVMYLENGLARNAFTEARSDVVGVLCSQAAVSIENATLYTDLRSALDRQRQITRSFERFVPKQFLEQLGRSSILDVELGDQVEREMSILFMDIRNFTTLSEQLTAKETFELVNLLLARVGPIIRQHHGFIDKYIGDAIMALFPGDADDAVRAAIDMQRSVAALRATATSGPQQNLRVGVGVHRGATMLGTIGEAERMDSTVISDAVNVASRIEGLTKSLGVSIAVSDATVRQVVSTNFSFRYLGRVDVKGKTSALAVHEVLDPQNKADALKLEVAGELARGVQLLESGDRSGATACFARVLTIAPEDGAARALLQRSLA